MKSEDAEALCDRSMSKARRNKNVFSFDLKVFRQLHNWISGAERAARAYSVSPLDCHQRTSRRLERHSRCNDTVRDETVQVRRCRRESHVERKNSQLVSHLVSSTSSQWSDRRRGSAWVRLGCCSNTRANEFCRRCSLVIDDVDASCKIELQ